MPVEKPMKFLANRKLASRIGIITTVITFAGMLLLWVIVSAVSLPWSKATLPISWWTP